MKSVHPRALIVEDDRAWQEILSEILGDSGLAVDVAPSLETALGVLRAYPHRLAVVDLSLSGKDPHNQDGLRVLEAVRMQDPGCTAVLLTGFATVELAVSALTQYGAFTCLQKENFQRSHFREIVHRALASAPQTRSPRTESRSGGMEIPGTNLLGEERPGGIGDKALVVEDDAGWRSILFELLADNGYQVRLCGSYGDALGWLRREKFNLAVIDLSLGGSEGWTPEEPQTVLEGYRLLEVARQEGIPSIVVSGVAAPTEIERVYREQGVFAFLEKQAFDRHTFLRTVRDARASALAGDKLESLTEREREILELLAQGNTNQEIADRLVISINTVKRHLKAIFRKLEIHTRSAAAARAAGSRVARDAGE